MQFSRFIAFGWQLRAGRCRIASTMAAACLLATPPAFAQDAVPEAELAPGVAIQPPYAAPGREYSPAPAVLADLAQVVFFRAGRQGTVAPGGAAHIYVNGEFHAALLPHGFTRLCLPKGSHAVEGYVGDAPLFAGKGSPATRVNLEGGKTYFVEVSENGDGEPRPFRRADAEQILEGAQEQRYVISRASTVVPCRDTLPAGAAS